MRKSLHAAMAAASMLVGLAGAAACSDYDPLDWDALVEREAQAFKESGIFDFATSGDVTLSIDYGVPAATNPVWIYTEYPFDDDGDLRPGVEPEFAFFLSGGKFEGCLNLPTYVERVYIVAGGIGLPGLIKADITGGAIRVGTDVTRAEVTSYVPTATARQWVKTVADFSDPAWATGGTQDGDEYYIGNRTIQGVSWYTTIESGSADKDGNNGTSNSRVNPGTNKTFTLNDRSSVELKGSIKTGGASTFDPNNLNSATFRGVLSFQTLGTGTIRVFVGHGSSSGDEKRTSVLYKEDANGTSATQVAEVSVAPSGLGVLELSDATAGTYYVKLVDKGTMSIHGVTFTTDANYLNVSDYYTSLVAASTFDLVENNSPGTHVQNTGDYTDVYESLYLLYPWSISGQPWLEQTGSETFGSATDINYKYTFYYDDAVPVFTKTPASSTGGISVQNDYLKNKYQDKDYTTEAEQGREAYKVTETYKYYTSIMNPDGETYTDALYAHQFLATSSDKGAKTSLTVKAAKAGYLTTYVQMGTHNGIYDYNIDDAAKIWLSLDGLTSAYVKSFEKKTEGYTGLIASHVTNGENTIGGLYKLEDMPIGEGTHTVYNHMNYTAKMVYFVFSETDGTSHYAYFGPDGHLVEKDAKNTIVDSDHMWFSLNNVDNESTEYLGSLTKTDAERTKYGFLLQGSNEIAFTIPAHTEAEVTIEFAHETENDGKAMAANFKYDDEKDNTKADGYTYKMTVSNTSDDTETHYIRKGGGWRHITKVTVEYKDVCLATTTRYAVKDYPNTDGAAGHTPLIEVEDFEGVKTRLFNTLWRGTGSKSQAKNQFGEDFNYHFAKTDESGNNVRVKDAGTKLYVTFLGEYDMTSANSFGYYYYPEGSAPGSPKDVKKFIILPNCTATDYANSRKYKVNTGDGYDYASYTIKDLDGTTGLAYDTRQIVPLESGDQVQLVYYDEEAGKFVEEFPQDMIVGWFVIYNGFDAWDNEQVGDGHIRLGSSNNAYGDRTQPDTKIYYSTPEWNTSTAQQARCIQLTDSKTGAISLCFEDSYSPDDGHYGNQDWTYDDLIILLSSQPNSSIENRSQNYTDDDIETHISYSQEGIYLFEDIWKGGKVKVIDEDVETIIGDEGEVLGEDGWTYETGTDYDMNDVAVRYRRTYNIKVGTPNATGDVTDAEITSIAETYTLMNDGATYNDGFAIKLPYNASDIKVINCSRSTRVLGRTTEEVETKPWVDDAISTVGTVYEGNPLEVNPEETDNLARLEYTDGTKEKLTLVLFDNINKFELGRYGWPITEQDKYYTYVVTTTFKTDKRPKIGYNTGKVSNSTLSGGLTTFNYGRGSYSPFVIVYNYGIKDGKRCEIHLTGDVVTQYGTVPGAEKNIDNNRWFVARIGQHYMPFGLDISDATFVTPLEGTPITEAYLKFNTWVQSAYERLNTSVKAEAADWYSNTGDGYRNTLKISWCNKE